MLNYAQLEYLQCGYQSVAHSHHDNSSFIVGSHDRNETGGGAHRGNHIFCLYPTGHLGDRHSCDLWSKNQM